MSEFKKELAGLLNKYCKDSDCSTPDFVLATFLAGCLDSFESAIKRRYESLGSASDLAIIEESDLSEL